MGEGEAGAVVGVGSGVGIAVPVGVAVCSGMTVGLEAEVQLTSRSIAIRKNPVQCFVVRIVPIPGKHSIILLSLVILGFAISRTPSGVRREH